MPLKSFIDVPADSHFPLENLPFGVFKPRDGAARIGVALGDYVVDLAALESGEVFKSIGPEASTALTRDSLNDFLALGRPTWKKVREILQNILAADNPTLRDNAKLRERVFQRQTDVGMQLPVKIGNYTDFYSSYYHSHNVGTMLRGPENALMPNWKWLPVAYHGRASSVVVSGTDVRRPKGQIKPPDAPSPVFGPTKSLDYELETAFLIGPGNPLGQPIPIDRAADHIFGFVLMNDWSARDVQAWEYQPLGPFLAKNFCTSISPWIVTMEALEPFRKPLPKQDPEPLPYLRAKNDFTFDIQLEAKLQTAKMETPQRITRTNFHNLYWSASQQLAHHAVGGCNLQPGDLLASGTISGPTEDSRGCMLELTWRGANPLKLESGEER
ncbi:MAG TPA: fumarylacetoacetase, partial [Chthoniobacterales bacterium]|nr:fumarylacetoacetase [Chthoniobacterales bacterium]